jgi:hypothetical protein
VVGEAERGEKPGDAEQAERADLRRDAGAEHLRRVAVVVDDPSNSSESCGRCRSSSASRRLKTGMPT